MNRIALFVFLLLLAGCNSHQHISDTYGPYHQIDSLMENGANPYDVASYLYEHSETLDQTYDFTDGEGYKVMTSADKDFRVYSILDWPHSSIYDVHNIFHYRNGRYDDAIHINADAGDWGYIVNIGMVKSGSKSYYILISEYESVHQGIYCTTMVSVYSLDEYIYNSLTREPIFITRDGRHLDSIEVSWADDLGFKSMDNLFGIAIDNPCDTKEIYIQVIDSGSGDALDQAIIYRWDGHHFTYAGILPKHFERKYD